MIHLYRVRDARTATSLAWAFTTNICIIELNEILKSINTVPIGHRYTYFPQDLPGRRPRHANMFCKPEGRNTALVSSRKINRPEPFYQRQIRRMKQRPCCYGYLIAAMRALIYFPSFYITRICRIASWTNKSIGPSNFNQNFFTDTFGTETFLPFQQRNFWHFHNRTSLAIFG